MFDAKKPGLHKGLNVYTSLFVVQCDLSEQLLADASYCALNNLFIW